MEWWKNFTSGIQNLAQGAPSIIGAINPPKAEKPVVIAEPKKDYTPLIIIGGIVAALLVVVALFKR